MVSKPFFDVGEMIDRQEKQVDDPYHGIWVDIPLSFGKFCKSSRHMNFPPLSEKQLDAAYVLCYGVKYKKFMTWPTDKRRRRISRMWNKDYNKVSCAVLEWGKGSGKDTLASIIICYLVYTLLMLRDPQSYFEMPAGEALDIINVAYSSDQAQKVFFEKFKQRILHWEWLRELYSIKQSGKVVSAVDEPDGNTVNIGLNGITFPKYIRTFSRHSEQESSEGLNLIAWVADEIAAFSDKTKKQNGKKMYKMLRTSAHSRFPGVWRGMAISYPRHENDCIEWLYNLGQGKQSFYCDKASTFEVNPTKFEKDFEEEKELDPEDFLQKYYCIPPKTLDAFFKFPARILECIDKDLKSIAMIEEILIEHQVVDAATKQPTGEVKHFVGNQIERFLLKGDDLKVPRVAHLDAGLVRDRGALVVAHGVPVILKMYDAESNEVKDVVVNQVVEDLIVTWQPDKKRDLQVSVNNMETMLTDLIKLGLRIRHVTYDQWNSASAIESLAKSGVKASQHTINTDDYKLLRNLVYAGGVRLLNHPVQRKELEQLQLKNGKKVDHPPEEDGGSKDISDCLAGVTRLLNDPEIRHEISKKMPRSTIGSSLMGSKPRPFGPEMVPELGGSHPLAGHPGVGVNTRITPTREIEWEGKKVVRVLEDSYGQGMRKRMPRSSTTSGTGSLTGHGGNLGNRAPSPVELAQRIRSFDS